MQRRLQGCRSPKQHSSVLQVHLEAAQLSLHLEGPALAQHGLHVRRQAGRLSFLAGEPDQEQDAKQPVVLSVALTLKSAQLPGPAQARRLDTAANQLETPLVRPHPAPCWQQQQIVLCTSVMLIKPVYWLPVWIRMKRRGRAVMTSMHRELAPCPPVWVAAAAGAHTTGFRAEEPPVSVCRSAPSACLWWIHLDAVGTHDGPGRVAWPVAWPNLHF